MVFFFDDVFFCMVVQYDVFLEILFLLFVNGVLFWFVGLVLFLCVCDGWLLCEYVQLVQLVCEQSFCFFVDVLEVSGWQVCDEQQLIDDIICYVLVLVLLLCQCEEVCVLFVCVLVLVVLGGIVVVCQYNNEGVCFGESDLQLLVGLGGKFIKNYCCVYWIVLLNGQYDVVLVQCWVSFDVLCVIFGGCFQSCLGIFVWDCIDLVLVLLVEQLLVDLVGVGVDLGSGFGYFLVEVLVCCLGVIVLDLYEVEGCVLVLVCVNLVVLGKLVVLNYYWYDVIVGIEGWYDFIVINLLFYILFCVDCFDIGQWFIVVVVEVLCLGGCMWLVVNCYLLYEQIFNESFGQVCVVVECDGFKLIEVIKVSRSFIFVRILCSIELMWGCGGCV